MLQERKAGGQRKVEMGKQSHFEWPEAGGRFLPHTMPSRARAEPSWPGTNTAGLMLRNLVSFPARVALIFRLPARIAESLLFGNAFLQLVTPANQDRRLTATPGKAGWISCPSRGARGKWSKLLKSV